MKKLISLTLATIFTMMCLFVSVSAEGNVLGDANGDGKVTVSDARMVLRVATKLEENKCELDVVDIDENGSITTVDARHILKVATKLDKFECIRNGNKETVIKETAPTCENSGEKIYKCDTCDKTRSEKINALGHNYSGDTCTRCGKKKPTIPGLSKDYSELQLTEIKPGSVVYNYMESVEWGGRGTVTPSGYPRNYEGINPLTGEKMICARSYEDESVLMEYATFAEGPNAGCRCWLTGELRYCGICGKKTAIFDLAMANPNLYCNGVHFDMY